MGSVQSARVELVRQMCWRDGFDRSSGMNPGVILLHNHQQTADRDAAHDQEKDSDSAQRRHRQDYAQQEQANYEMHLSILKFAQAVGKAIDRPILLAFGQLAIALSGRTVVFSGQGA